MRISKIDKIRSHIALLTVGLMTTVTTQAALVGHWTFDETSGTNAVDSSGGGYDGMVENPIWTSGVIGGALEFDGTCKVSDFGSVLATTATELSISVWCFGDASKPDGNLFSAYFDGGRKLNCHFPFSNGRIYFDANSATTRDRIDKAVATEDEPLVWGKWNHWVFTKNTLDGTMKIYANGMLWHDGTGKVDPMASGAEFFIGSDSSSLLYQGIMDDFRVYDHELSETEITDLFTAVTPEFTSASISASPESGTIPMDVFFSGTNSASSGSITNFSWNFGDGSMGVGADVMHTYTNAGVYTVTLTVTDDRGESDTDQIDIEAKQAIDIELDYTVESLAFEELPSVSSNDLAQIYYAGSTGTADNPARLFDGLIMSNPPVEDDQTTDSKWTAGEYVTVEFDLSENDLGYDITNVTSIAGWPIGNGGRSNQGYELLVTYVDGSQGLLAEATHWAPNNPASYWTKVSIFEENNGVMASGVKSVTINFSEDANAGGVVLGREFDIFGVPTPPKDADVPVIAFTNGTSSLTWNANGDFLYSVQSKHNLSVGGGWDTVTTVLGTPPQTTIDLPAKDENVEFYRVIVE